MKSTLRLIRELRAAKRQGFITDFCIERATLGRSVAGPAQCTEHTPLPLTLDPDRPCIQVKLAPHIEWSCAQRLNTYLKQQFSDIDRVVMHQVANTSTTRCVLYNVLLIFLKNDANSSATAV